MSNFLLGILSTVLETILIIPFWIIRAIVLTGAALCIPCIIVCIIMVVCKTDLSMYMKNKNGGYDNPQDNNIDEAYLLFMGDAVLRSNHPEADTAQREYCNENHEHHEAW